MNNTSMFTADRATHMKLVVVSLIAATMIATGGLYARVASYSANPDLRASAPIVIKAGQPALSAKRDGVVVR
jgi:hypothetical protein